MDLCLKDIDAKKLISLESIGSEYEVWGAICKKIWKFKGHATKNPIIPYILLEVKLIIIVV